jgi:hypothetical protein
MGTCLIVVGCGTSLFPNIFAEINGAATSLWDIGSARSDLGRRDPILSMTERLPALKRRHQCYTVERLTAFSWSRVPSSWYITFSRFPSSNKKFSEHRCSNLSRLISLTYFALFETKFIQKFDHSPWSNNDLEGLIIEYLSLNHSEFMVLETRYYVESISS